MKTMNQATAFNAGLSFDTVQSMKENPVYLTHKSGRKFQFVKEFQPQFGTKMTMLLNLKTGKLESFMSHTYKRFFSFND